MKLVTAIGLNDSDICSSGLNHPSEKYDIVKLDHFPK